MLLLLVGRRCLLSQAMFTSIKLTPILATIWLNVLLIQVFLPNTEAAIDIGVKFDPSTKKTTLHGIPLSKILSPFHELGPDAYADPPEFIRSRQFGAEVHHVITKDNYILTMHRIINPLVPANLRAQLKPVLLQHGVFTSSFNFIIGSDRNHDRPRFDPRDLTRTWPKDVYIPHARFSWQRIIEMLNDYIFSKLHLTQSSDRFHAPHLSDCLGFEMANQGYDVWMGNARGSTYSLNHTKFDYRHDWRYWDFSFHEIALYDMPAQIDYILDVRKKKSLAFIGHSQGNLAMFILQSLNPAWKHKIKPFIALAPIAFIPNVYYGSFRIIIKAIESTLITTTQLNRVLKGRIFPNDPLTGRALDLVCVPKWSSFMCNLALSLITGDNLKRTNDSLIPTIAHHIPEGTSILNMLHFGQMVESGQFRAFDFGTRDNIQRYGQPTAPFYPIKRISSPDIAFVVGRTDTLSTQRNVELTRSMLSVPLMDYYLVDEQFWGHADYMYAIGAGRIANAHIIGLTDRYRLIDM